MKHGYLLGLVLVGCSSSPTEQSPSFASEKYNVVDTGVIYNPCNQQLVSITTNTFKQVSGDHVRYVITFTGTDDQGNSYVGQILDNYTVNAHIVRQRETVEIITATPGLSFTLEVSSQNDRIILDRATCE